MPPMDMNLLLKTLRVDVPRFDGLNVDNRIYRINKFFSLHHIDPGTRLAMVCKNFFLYITHVIKKDLINQIKGYN